MHSVARTEHFAISNSLLVLRKQGFFEEWCDCFHFWISCFLTLYNRPERSSSFYVINKLASRKKKEKQNIKKMNTFKRFSTLGCSFRGRKLWWIEIPHTFSLHCIFFIIHRNSIPFEESWRSRITTLWRWIPQRCSLEIWSHWRSQP